MIYLRISQNNIHKGFVSMNWRISFLIMIKVIQLIEVWRLSKTRKPRTMTHYICYKAIPFMSNTALELNGDRGWYHRSCVDFHYSNCCLGESVLQYVLPGNTEYELYNWQITHMSSTIKFYPLVLWINVYCFLCSITFLTFQVDSGLHNFFDIKPSHLLALPLKPEYIVLYFSSVIVLNKISYNNEVACSLFVLRQTLKQTFFGGR